jgi:hypothetical protein
VSQKLSIIRAFARPTWLRGFLRFVLVVAFCPIVAPAYADLWAAATFHDSVLRIDENTGAILPGGVTYQSAGLSFPAGVAIGPDGNIYVSSKERARSCFMTASRVRH